MFLSQFKAPAQQRVTVSKFGGYDARRRAPLGSFARMENLTGDGYPTLSVREKRKTIAALDKPNGLAAKDSLIWVDGRTLYINGLAIDLALTDGEKQLVSMGAYLLIWPDKKYLNTKDIRVLESFNTYSIMYNHVFFVFIESVTCFFRARNIYTRNPTE
mgnify:CR=1 FL=1